MSRKNQSASGRLPKPVDEHDRKLLADIERHGWHVLAIKEDEEGPAFAYSIGLYRSFRHPEIIIFGLPIQLMQRLVNVIGEEVRSKERFEHLDESAEVLDGYNVAFRTVERRHYPECLGYARWFYSGDDFPALQCVWPDSQHRYLWHAQFNANLAQRQPLLSDDWSWPFHEGKNRAVLTTKHVLQDGHAILLVTHDGDGDWQFLCGTTNRPKDGQLVSLGCIYERDRTLAQLADLPEGFRAYRQVKGAAWKRARCEEE
jgi:hypothetical protein